MTPLQFKDVFVPEFSAWVEWEEGGFDVEVRYLSQESSERLLKECQNWEYNTKTHQREAKLDEQRFRAKISDLLTNWRNFTASKAAKFVKIKDGTDMSAEFPFTPDNKAFVMKAFPGFASFILDSAKELHKAGEVQREVEEKN